MALIASADFAGAAGLTLANINNQPGPSLPGPFAQGDWYDRYGGSYGMMYVQTGPNGYTYARSVTGPGTGNPPLDSNFRAEQKIDVGYTYGGITAIAFDIYWPAGTPVRSAPWGAVWQLKDSADEGTPLVLLQAMVQGYGGYVLRSNAAGAPSIPLGACKLGAVERICIATLVSTSNGWVSVWRDGVKVVNQQNWNNATGSTKMVNGAATYTKFGLYGYGQSAQPQQEAWFTRFRWANGSSDLAAATDAGYNSLQSGGVVPPPVDPNPPAAIPVAPKNVRLAKPVEPSTVAGHGKVTVTCDPNSDLIAGDGYYLYRNDAAAPLNSTPSASTTIVDADAGAYGITNTYRMSAGNIPSRDGGWSDPALSVPIVNPTTSDTTPPAAPARPTAVTQTSTTVGFQWAANTEPDLSHYILNRSVNGGAYSVLQANQTAAAYIDGGLTTGNTYAYTVQAVDASGNTSAASQPFTVTLTSSLTTPTGVATSSTVPHRVTVTWSAVSGAPGYQVSRDGTVIASGVTGTSYVDTSADPGDHVYAVAAGISPNLSAPSAGVLGVCYGILGLTSPLTFATAYSDSTTTQSTTLSLTGRGGWSVTDSAAWLTVSPTSGTLSDTPTVVTLTATPTGLNAGSTPVTATATASFTEIVPAPAPGIPVNTTAPAVTGTVRVGQTLTGSSGAWSGSPTGYTYQWQRNTGASWADISGATSSTYVLVSGDLGATIRVGVKATNGTGTSPAFAYSTATSAALAAAAAPSNTAVPVITGSAVQGQVLSATTGTWNANGSTITGYTYQWKRAGTNISGATSATYTLVSGDVGSAITVAVVATNGIGSSSAATSAATATVVASGGSLVLARYALALDGASHVILANASSTGTEPKTFAAVFYNTAGSSDTVTRHVLQLTQDTFNPGRGLYAVASGGYTGYYDQAFGGSVGTSGLPQNAWVLVVVSRNNDANSTLRSMWCNLATGVWSSLYQSGTDEAGWARGGTYTGNWVIGADSEPSTATTYTFKGRILALFSANAFYTSTQMQALLSSTSGTYYVDPSVWIAAPSAEHVWLTGGSVAPTAAIQDVKGTANETSRVGTASYDAGSASLPLKVS